MTQGPIVWVVIAEIFPNRIRGRAMAIATAALWIADFAVSLSFPVIADKLHESFAFGLYAAMCAIDFVFIAAMLPETKGKTLEEIETSRLMQLAARVLGRTSSKSVRRPWWSMPQPRMARRTADDVPGGLDGHGQVGDHRLDRGSPGRPTRSSSRSSRASSNRPGSGGQPAEHPAIKLADHLRLPGVPAQLLQPLPDQGGRDGQRRLRPDADRTPSPRARVKAPRSMAAVPG